MFGRNSKKLETIIGEGTEVEGALTVKETVRIDGVMDGDVRADWVIVGENGRITGNVRARGVVVGGRVEGNIEAEEVVELKSKARVCGEVHSPRLAVSEGAVFDGQSVMTAGGEAREGQEGRVITLPPSAAPS